MSNHTSADPLERDDEIFNPEITFEELQHKLWDAHVRTTLRSLFGEFEHYVPTMSREDVLKFFSRRPKDC